MSCARPLNRVYNPKDHNITGSIMTLETYRERTHNLTATYESIAYRTDVMLLPCGKCLGCRLRQRQDWETRMLMESKTLTPVWFLTLTWNQEYVPGMVRETGEIIRGAVHQWTTGDAPEVVQILLQEDMVRFNKRLRKKAGSNTVDALSGADHKAKSGKVPNLNPMNKYINGGK